MFKVSFKGDFKKVRVFNNRATIVTLVGIVDIPAAMWNICLPTPPEDVMNWLRQHSVTTTNTGKLRIEFSGKSVCSKEDSFDPVIGERLAEARAKIRIYHFMCVLLYKLCEYLSNLLYGTDGIVNPTDQGLTGAYEKYEALYIKESHHLGKLLEES